MRIHTTTVVSSAMLVILAAVTSQAQAQPASSPDQGRVISSVPIVEPDSRAPGQEQHIVGYTVIYEFGGRRYTTQMAQAPGASIPLQISPVGVMTRSAVQADAPLQQSGSPWQNVVPETGLVVFGAGAVAIPYPQTTYLAPTYVYAPPVYVAPYGYAPSYFPAPYYAAPIGLSLNFGYSRGWGGRHGRWR